MGIYEIAQELVENDREYQVRERMKTQNGVLRREDACFHVARLYFAVQSIEYIFPEIREKNGERELKAFVC